MDYILKNCIDERINEVSPVEAMGLLPSKLILNVLYDEENIDEKCYMNSQLIKLTIMYLTEFVVGIEVGQAFLISLRGAAVAAGFGLKDSIVAATTLANSIDRELDNTSIINACRLASFAMWYRDPVIAAMPMTPKYNEISLDDATIHYIRVLVNRGKLFVLRHGNIIDVNCNFNPVGAELDVDTVKIWEMLETGKGMYGGYTPKIWNGEVDFITDSAIWDFDISKTRPLSEQVLKLFIHWIMGLHSKQPIYNKVNKLGIFNPFLNRTYSIDTKDIPKELIEMIENEIICYE